MISDLSNDISVVEQMDRASTSIPLNIAEGNGKHTENDRCSYFDNARGSAFECASCLDVLEAKQLLDETTVENAKDLLREIVSMLIGLIRSNSNRVHDHNSVESYSVSTN